MCREDAGSLTHKILICMSTELLREVISLLVSESVKDDEGKAEDRDPEPKTVKRDGKTLTVLTEPDYTKPSNMRAQKDTDETDEVSVSANVAGASVPLGYGPEGSPQSSRQVKKKRKSVTDAIGRAFGGAKPIKPF